MERVYSYLEECTWHRLASKDGTISLGGKAYYLGPEWIRKQTKLAFERESRMLRVEMIGGDKQTWVGLKLTQEELVGDLARRTNLPQFQMELPYTWEDWRLIRHCDLVPITT